MEGRKCSLIGITEPWLLTLQLQGEREKYAYDYDNLQSQLDKSQGQLSRVQKEKETTQQELDRTHDKYDKQQVLTLHIITTRNF